MTDFVDPTLTESLVRELVHSFYEKVKVNSHIGPIFIDRIGSDWEDWQDHLEIMVNFWCAVMGLSKRYRGNPMRVHRQIEALAPEHFATWLMLFRETATEICTPEVSRLFIERSEMIARNLRAALFPGPDVVSNGPPVR